MQILKYESPDQHNSIVTAAVTVLKNGGLVVFPTETTYGLGADATNPEAVAKLLRFKARREGKPLSIAVTDQAMAEEFVELTDSARRVYQRFLPGPVTVVSADKGKLAPGVASEFATVGVRIPDYPLVHELVRGLAHPITATSANASDGKRPYAVADIFESLSTAQRQLIDLVIDVGELPHRPPSTVIDTTHSTPVTFRQGDIQVEGSASANANTVLDSMSEQETKDIAGKLLLKHWNQLKSTGLIIGLDGSLGVGKTIFTKGIAEFLQITEPLTSPTYTYMEEYDYTRHGQTGRLYHLDVWKVETPEEFNFLNIPSLIKPGNVIVIEWWHQIKDWWQPQSQAPLLTINLDQTSDQGRRITIAEKLHHAP
jgi:tRNA threonylcarbamoyl adenosine modification protein (Sua5/YciO/YrdC/YwlC family)/tRNA threonylcarbamoyl adenosine modification protein YjeE